MAAKKKSSKTGRVVYARGGNRLEDRAAKGPRDISYLKPPKFKDHLTLSETAKAIPCDPSWLRHLEREGRIPKASRVQRGQLQVRLWSPEQVEEIRSIIDNHKVGRPPSE